MLTQRRVLPTMLLALGLAAFSIPAGLVAQTKAASQAKGGQKAPPAPRMTLEDAGSRTGRDRFPTYEGKEVIVSGQVSTKPIWVADAFYVAIQDEMSFGLVLRPEIPQLPDLMPGDWV